MTHAFFKALLFMAAGSVISAMARQPEPRQDGRLPQGDAVHVRLHGRSAASRCRASRRSRASSPRTRSSPTSPRAAAGTSCSRVLGYVGAFLTAIYTFRMIFRAFCGRAGRGGARARARPPLPRARAHEPGDRRGRGHRRRLPRARSTTSPSAEAPMKVAMGCSPCWRDRRRRRSRSRASPTSLAPLPRADVRRLEALRRARAVDGLTVVGLVIGAVLGDRAASRSPTTLWVRKPERAAARCARGSPACTAFFVNKWYFDELIDFLIVRPFAWFGRFGAQHVRARRRSTALLIGGTTGAVRAGSAAVRAVQSGFLRYYAALLLLGVTGARPLLPGLGLHDHPPARSCSSARSRSALLGALAPRTLGAGGRARRRARAARLRGADAVRLRHAARRAAVRHRRRVDRGARASATSSASTG